MLLEHRHVAGVLVDHQRSDEGDLVTVRVDGPRRWYALRPEPLAELDEWLAPYRWMWESSLDRLGAHLDAMPPMPDRGDPDGH